MFIAYDKNLSLESNVHNKKTNLKTNKIGTKHSKTAWQFYAIFQTYQKYFYLISFVYLKYKVKYVVFVLKSIKNL